MLRDLLLRTYFGNPVQAYGLWLALLLTLVLVIRLLKNFIIDRLKALAAKTETTLDDFLIAQVEKTLLPLLYFAAFYFCLRVLTIPAYVAKDIRIAGVILITVLTVRFILALMNYVLEARWSGTGHHEARAQSVRGGIVVIKFVVILLATIVLLDNLGVKISALVAGLGIGGVAVALASQAVLGDLFGFFVILFDRPFDIGDVIMVGDHTGTVEKVGIKTTRVRSISGEQLVFSNTYLTNAQVRNFKRMDKRRVVFTFGVVYSTPAEKLRAVPELIRQIVLAVGDTSFDRAHFASYGDFALNFEVVYFVQTADYNRYMDIQQEINLRIKEEFEKRGISFAYPTQTVLLSK